jgi:disulfide bond formation protein DsbB
MTTQKNLILLAAGGSAALLAGAFFFQSLGWAPCEMCLWQRWPHAAAIGIGLIYFLLPARIFALLGALMAAVAAGLAIYHSGVERDWWEGPSSCTGSSDALSGLDTSSLLPGGSDVPALVLCDTFEPFFLGLTMANWNAFASIGLLIVWVMAARAR